MVKGEQPAQYAVDDFTNLLLSFNSSNKIQLNVINIISETMCSRAEEIACLIMKTYEQNAELGIVIDQLSVRNSLYKQLFETYARQRVQKGTMNNSFAQERTGIYDDKAEGNEVEMPDLNGPASAEVGESTLTSPSNKQPRERKNLRHRTANVTESGTKKRSMRMSGIKAENAGSVHKVGGLGRVDEKRHKKGSNLVEQERHVKGTASVGKDVGQIHTTKILTDKGNFGDEEIGRKKMKTTCGLLDELELLVIRGLEVEDATKTINTQLLDETLFKTIQCKICGLRYSPDEKEVLSLHLADHQRRIRASESKAVVSRDYMCRKNEWLVSKLNLPSIRADRKAITCSKPQTCKICKNKICLSWCDDTEQWILEDAVEIGGSQYCHRKCVE